MNQKAIAFVRLALPLYAMIYALLLSLRYSPILFTPEKIDAFITGAIGVIVAWWKNNNFKPEAQKMQKALDDKKAYNKLKDI
ncbi:phage holin [Exiguobacterium sp. s127]|uniref:phage holin n=1 Tax=Exiguobacterium sp. s127 TaxID=2751210 RepID=UPI001BEB202D|nr:phage holin [Exiguobacterium sp. s127]